MPSLEQRVEALERQMADLQAMLESLLDCMRQQEDDGVVSRILRTFSEAA